MLLFKELVGGLHPFACAGILLRGVDGDDQVVEPFLEGSSVQVVRHGDEGGDGPQGGRPQRGDSLGRAAAREQKKKNLI